MSYGELLKKEDGSYQKMGKNMTYINTLTSLIVSYWRDMERKKFPLELSIN